MQDILISKITIPSLSAESIRRETLYRKLKKYPHIPCRYLLLAQDMEKRRP